MRKVFLIGLLQYWFVQVAFPQNDHYSIRNYTAVDGLPQSQVWDLTEDQNGYLWLCTEGGGLARFDGREFKVYTTQDGLLSNNIASVFIDSQQRLWARHADGVTRIDGGEVKKFQLPRSPGMKVVAKGIFASADTVFLLDGRGALTKIYQDSVYYFGRTFKGDTTVRWVQSGSNNILYYFMDNGICHVEDRNKTPFVSFDVTMPGQYLDVINWKDRLLINTIDGLFELSVLHHRLEKLSWSIADGEWMLEYDSTRNVLWATNGDLLFKETIRNNVLQRDTVLRDVSIHKVLIDSEGNTWFATDGRGLFKYFIQDFDRFTPENITGVMAVLMDTKKSVWLGTMKQGLWRVTNGKTISYPQTHMEGRSAIHAIKQARDGTIWVGSGYGLGKYDEQKDTFQWFTRADGLSGHSILTLDLDDHGGMWIGTRNGIIYYDGKTFHNTDVKKMGPSRVCWALTYLKTHQTLFFRTDKGLSGIKDGASSAVPLLAFPTPLITLKSYNDSLLVLGTGGNGAMIYDPRSHKKYPITVREGLASDFVYFAGQDEKGYLWIGTEKGINRLMLNSKYDVIENLHYGYENGLAGIETNQNAFSFNGGEKYFGLVDGAYRFNDLPSNPNKAFNLHLTDVQILYGEYPAADYADSLYSFFKIPYHPVFPPDKNHITFHFNRVDKQHPKSVKFKYFLENFDKAWSPPSSMDRVTYGNLPPGDYIFRVAATDSRGSWGSKSIAYAFTVRSPFYMRTSFILGTIILLVGLVTLILYIRVKQRIRKVVQLERIRVKEQEKLRKEIARDFHDEMGNYLTRIINYVSLLKLNGNGSHHFKQDELYTKVEESAKYLYSGTRDFIWGIDPVNDELSKLFIHIRDFGEKLFEEKGICFRAFNNEVKENVKLPYGFSREANLIFKEAMTNAFKYSEAQNITFSLHRQEDDFQLILHDDGKGFYCGEIESSNGLKNIRERADRINAVLRISSAKDQGTTITLVFTHLKKITYGVAL